MFEAIRSAANPGFRFIVEIYGDKNKKNKIQGVFTECTLPTLEWEVQEIKEGGMNDYSHRLPVRQKGARLTLKNGLGVNDLLDWCIDSITMGESFERKAITVTLCNVSNSPLISWTMLNAYPVKWTAPGLKSDDNTIAIQTLELVGDKVTVEKLQEAVQNNPSKQPEWNKAKPITRTPRGHQR